jgi:hypothetical protein
MGFVGPCCRCKSEMWLPDEFEKTARRSEAITFYCPYGHAQVFRAGETEVDKLRRERDRLAQRVAEWQDEARSEREKKEAAERRAAAARGQVTKIRNRVGHGVCPCCNRTFGNLSRHMASEHPTFAAEAVE